MRVGVVIPAHNVAGFVGDAVRSLRAQTFRGWAAVVVDDGSTDATFLDAMEAAGGDPRVRVFSQPNAGVSAARNSGRALLAGAEALLFLDADDWLEPDALWRMVSVLREVPRAVAAVGDFAFVAEAATPAAPGAIDARRAQAGNLARRLHIGNVFANGGHVLARAALMPAFPEALRFGEDWVAWAALALRGPFARVPGVCLYVRKRAGGAMGRWAGDPRVYAGAIDAVHDNPGAVSRFGARGAAKLRGLARAEADWIAGRAKLPADPGAARALLRRSVARAPSLRRLAALAVLHARAA